MTLLNFVTLSTSFAFLAYGLHCLFSASMKLEFKRYGLEKIRVLTGLLEIAGGLGLLVGLKFQIILALAALGLAFMMFVAILVRVRIKDRLMQLLPALFLLFVNLYILMPAQFGAIFNVSGADTSDPAVVSQVDLNKYSGKWFEIAKYPTFFQRNCIASTAEYAVQADNTLSVYNVCYKADKSTSDIKGTATIVDPATPAKLKVKFNLLAQGQYWIVALDPDYQWAVISSSKKSSLFVLARTAPMETELMKKIISDLKARGFETEKMIFDQY